MACVSQELKEGRQHAATLERQMHELEASSGASQVQAAELAGLRDRVTTLATQLKVSTSVVHHTGESLSKGHPCGDATPVSTLLRKASYRKMCVHIYITRDDGRPFLSCCTGAMQQSA